MFNLKQAFGQATAPEEAPEAPAQEPMTMPMTQDGDTVFIDKSLLPEGKRCKPGDTLLLRVKVESVGSKVAVSPVAVEDYGTEDGPEAEGDDD